MIDTIDEIIIAKIRSSHQTMVEDAIAITVQLIKKLFIIGLEIFLGGFDTETNPQARFVPDIHEALIDDDKQFFD